MKALVIGGGGREHALVWAMSKSRSIGEVICMPGNPGIENLARCEEGAIVDVNAVAASVRRIRPDLLVVGPEAPLVAGLADLFQSDHRTKVFGPTSLGARLEGSKSFAKQLMTSKGIPTAAAEAFTEPHAALSYAATFDGNVVVKADGLAAGKGVTVCGDMEAADKAIREAMVDRRFGPAGATILIEQKLEGEEISVLAFSDGKSVVAMPGAQDHKRAYDNDTGPNTGGMGAYSPVPFFDGSIEGQVTDRILEPAIHALSEQGEPYVGVLYAGLMLTSEGPKVIEFNCRFGDPETQALVPRFSSDLGEVLVACTEGGLAGVQVKWSDQACVSVVAASQGYPEVEPIRTGYEITGIGEAESITGVPVFQAGTANRDGRLVTAGGRVLAVSALGPTVAAAASTAYEALSKIDFEGMRMRTDIGARAIN